MKFGFDWPSGCENIFENGGQTDAGARVYYKFTFRVRATDRHLCHMRRKNNCGTRIMTLANLICEKKIT